MQIVVPLAGADFELADGTTKAERDIDGTPFLRAAIEGRSWWRRGAAGPADLCFVLRDTAASRTFATGPLARWYPGARTVFLGGATAGAALSALAGVAQGAPAGPLCVDLADILYADTVDPVAAFAAADDLGGIALTFASDLPIYSYLALDGTGAVVLAAEKSVISEHASAGTYLFRDAAVYLDAVAHALRHPDQATYRGAFFVCPLFNGVLAAGRRVTIAPVSGVRDPKVTSSA